MDHRDDGAGSRGLGMEARVKALEDDMREIKADLRRLALDVAEIKGAGVEPADGGSANVHAGGLDHRHFRWRIRPS
jgi:hypothetical protein